MTKEQKSIYEQTVKRLARGGIKDPTAQIIALAEEIERYRDKIRWMEGLRIEVNAPRYTHYDPVLGRFVVPLYPTENNDHFVFSIGMRSNTYPDCVFGEVIDKLAALENREEESHAT